MKTGAWAAALAAILFASSPSSADPLAKGLKIQHVDRAFKAAAAASGVSVDIGKVNSCGPGEPGYFCSYNAGNGLVVWAGAPTLKGAVDSLEIRSTERHDTAGLRLLLALMIDIIQPKLSAKQRDGILHALVDAIPQGSATVQGDRMRFSFHASGGDGLIFNAQRPFE